MSGKRAKLLRRVLNRSEVVEMVDVNEEGVSVTYKQAALNPVGVRVFRGNFKRPNIMVCLPSANGLMPLEVHLTLLQLVAPLNGTVDYYCLSHCEVGVARNMFAERARGLGLKPDYLMFIGDDMLPPWDGMLKLWEEMERNKWDVLGGLYHWKSDPAIALCWKDEVGYPDESQWKPEQVVPCQVLGMDFTMVRMSMLDKLGDPPWWRTTVVQDPENGGIVKVTEDSYFCRKVEEAGGKIAVHTGVKCGHLDVKTGKVY